MSNSARQTKKVKRVKIVKIKAGKRNSNGPSGGVRPIVSFRAVHVLAESESGEHANRVIGSSRGWGE